jgi:hypothetical protein
MPEGAAGRRAGSSGVQTFANQRRQAADWAVDALYADQAKRIVVTDVETFVGQNSSEIGRFATKDTRATLGALFKQYNERWLPPVGAGGLRIIDPESLGD